MFGYGNQEVELKRVFVFTGFCGACWGFGMDTLSFEGESSITLK
jgi:hypothetical protein